MPDERELATVERLLWLCEVQSVRSVLAVDEAVTIRRISRG